MKTVIDISNLPNPGVAVPTERFTELIAAEQALVTANAKLDRLRSLPKFAHLLAAHGVVQESAVFDAENYDRGETLNRIAGAHAEIWASL